VCCDLWYKTGHILVFYLTLSGFRHRHGVCNLCIWRLLALGTDEYHSALNVLGHILTLEIQSLLDWFYHQITKIWLKHFLNWNLVVLPNYSRAFHHLIESTSTFWVKYNLIWTILSIFWTPHNQTMRIALYVHFFFLRANKHLIYMFDFSIIFTRSWFQSSVRII